MFVFPVTFLVITAATATLYVIDRWAWNRDGLRATSHVLALAVIVIAVPLGQVNVLLGILPLFFLFYWLLTGRCVGTGAGVYQPHRTHDGKLRVGGGWSIRRNGPRFPTTGVIRRSLRATPYGMSVSATFSGDGAELLYVSINFSTL
ncbi:MULTISPECIES: hypothetical protein [unclassified Roseovarius]|uniref:hypothetical protein n=1 Tax=unclassified Roseovarius TaxID=2614913 RepID=UPI00273D2BBA|nr:hypothetical protein [Roseovarius sp. MMSF_3350]